MLANEINFSSEGKSEDMMIMIISKDFAKNQFIFFYLRKWSVIK